jgi:hypothetical protein
VDEGATVESSIKASRVIIKGSVKGDITASEKVELTVTGRLNGNIAAPEIFMETGCAFNGRCTMTDKKLVPRRAFFFQSFWRFFSLQARFFLRPRLMPWWNTGTGIMCVLWKFAGMKSP